MSRAFLRAAVGILVAFASLFPSVEPQSKRRVSSSTEPCPDNKTYTGRYRNRVYGFSIVIPAGLKGYWNSARCAPDGKYDCVCMGDHGRFIPISDDAHIEAFVGYQMESEWSARIYETNDISYLKERQGVDHLKVLGSRWIRLSNLRARRFVDQFVEKNKRRVWDQIFALYNGVEYRLILSTSADRYQGDKRKFEKVVASWKLTPRLG